MRKALFTLVLGLASHFATTAQEAATYAQYQLYPVLYNPGVTGFSGNHEFIVNARKAQTSFPGTPISYTAMYHGSVGDKLGLGAQVFSEKIGDMSTTKIQGNYAFRFRLQKAQIGIGLTTEFINKNVSGGLLSDPLVQAGDPVVEDQVGGQQIFDATAGMHLLYDEKLFVALAFPNTVRTRLDQGTIDGPITNAKNDRTNYFFHFGYIMSRPAQGYSLIPSLAIRNYRDVPFQFDVNLQGRFLEDKLLAAITMRPGGSGIAGFMLGTMYKDARIVYSYDIAFGPFQQYHTGSHELSLSYVLKPKSKRAMPAAGDSK
jgi:type IX secretion system PorP/SprF family membrane protein